LTRAGFTDVRVMAETYLAQFADANAYWQEAMNTGERQNIAALSAEQVEQARAALADQLAQYRQADGLHIPATALIATATRA
jgi:hypothetical protein